MTPQSLAETQIRRARSHRDRMTAEVAQAKNGSQRAAARKRLRYAERTLANEVASARNVGVPLDRIAELTGVPAE